MTSKHPTRRFSLSAKNIFIAILPVIIIVIFTIINRRQPSLLLTENQASPTISPPPISLPPGWSFSEPAPGTVFKIVKSSQDKVKPSIILSVTSYSSDLPENKYVDNLIKGARSTLPSLKFHVNKPENIDSFYLRQLLGTYVNNRNLVRIQQRIYIQGKNVNTLTASYLSQNLDSEIKSIFDTIFDQTISR